MFDFLNFSSKKYNFSSRSRYYLGSICVVIREIEYGRGKIKASDSTIWNVIGMDCPVNTKVEIVEVVDVMLFRVRQVC